MYTIIGYTLNDGKGFRKIPPLVVETIEDIDAFEDNIKLKHGHKKEASIGLVYKCNMVEIKSRLRPVKKIEMKKLKLL